MPRNIELGSYGIEARSPRRHSSPKHPPPRALYTTMGKVHGSLTNAGKVKSKTPKVEKEDKPKPVTGRAKRRLLYTRRFVNVTVTNGKRK